MYQRLSIEAPQYDVSSEGEDRPSDNSNGDLWPDEVDPNAVTIGIMSIDSKSVATDGERGRYREISSAGEAVVNPDDWPNVDLKPSCNDTWTLEVKRYTILKVAPNDTVVVTSRAE